MTCQGRESEKGGMCDLPSARDKLNVLYALYCFGIASWFGWIFDSSLMMTIALVVLVAMCCEGRFFR